MFICIIYAHRPTDHESQCARYITLTVYDFIFWVGGMMYPFGYEMLFLLTDPQIGRDEIYKRFFE